MKFISAIHCQIHFKMSNLKFKYVPFVNQPVVQNSKTRANLATKVFLRDGTFQKLFTVKTYEEINQFKLLNFKNVFIHLNCL